MIKFMKKLLAQAQPEKRELRRVVKHVALLLLATAAALLALRGGVLLHAQSQNTNNATNNDKYSMLSPGGIAFADFRGYEDWSVVSSARTEDALPEEILKVIVANPKMIAAYKAGVPANGQLFPEGSMIVKLQWKPKKSTEAPFAVDVPDVFKQAFVMEKNSARFPKTGGWGYAVFNYDAASGKFTPDPKSLSDCGQSCHVAVKAKDYIFHPYQQR